MSDFVTIRKNSREEIRVSLDDFKGQMLVNLRVWFQGETGQMLPGKQGIAFRVDTLPEVLVALHKVKDGVRA